MTYSLNPHTHIKNISRSLPRYILTSIKLIITDTNGKEPRKLKFFLLDLSPSFVPKRQQSCCLYIFLPCEGQICPLLAI